MRGFVHNVKIIYDSFCIGNMPLMWCTGRAVSREGDFPASLHTRGQMKYISKLTGAWHASREKGPFPFDCTCILKGR